MAFINYIEITKEVYTMKNIDIKDFAKLVESGKDINLIDVRPEDYYTDGHIPGAENVPLENLEDHLGRLDKNTHYYTVCHDGVRSKKAAELLTEHGFDTTYIKQGTPEYPGELETGK